jgi:hypothetical protein
MSFLQQLVRVFLINAEGLSFALPVRPVGPFFVGAFIGVQAAPFQTVENILFGPFDIAALVRIFDAQDKIPSCLSGKQVVVKNRPDASQVEPSRGAGGKADPDFFTHRAQRYTKTCFPPLLDQFAAGNRPGGSLLILNSQILKYLSAVLIFLILSWWSPSPARAQLTYATLTVQYDSAWQYKNLKIIPIRRKEGGGEKQQGGQPNIVSLSQALRQGLVTVTERGTASIDNVHWLRINNHSDKSLYVASGEIIAGGRQDRMITRDTILVPTQKDQYIPTMCVEEGRWSDKEKKFAYGNFANPHLRKVLDSTKNQVLIWNEVDKQLEEANFKNTTTAYLARNQDKKYIQVNDEYFNFFRQKFMNTDSNIVGFVCVSGNKVVGSDIFADGRIFYAQLEPLLRGYIDESIIFGAPVALPDPPVKRYMDKLLKDEASQEEFARKNGKIFRQNGRVFHVNTFLKDNP